MAMPRLIVGSQGSRLKRRLSRGRGSTQVTQAKEPTRARRDWAPAKTQQLTPGLQDPAILWRRAIRHQRLTESPLGWGVARRGGGALRVAGSACRLSHLLLPNTGYSLASITGLYREARGSKELLGACCSSFKLRKSGLECVCGWRQQGIC